MDDAPAGPNVGFHLRVHDLVRRDNIVRERRLARNKPPPRLSAQASDHRNRRRGNRKATDVIGAARAVATIARRSLVWWRMRPEFGPPLFRI